MGSYSGYDNLSQERYEYARAYYPGNPKAIDVQDHTRRMQDALQNPDVFVVLTPEGFGVSRGMSQGRFYQLWEKSSVIDGGAVLIATYRDMATGEPLPIDKRAEEYFQTLDKGRLSAEQRKRNSDAYWQRIQDEEAAEQAKKKANVVERLEKEILVDGAGPKIVVDMGENSRKSKAKSKSKAE